MSPPKDKGNDDDGKSGQNQCYKNDTKESHSAASGNDIIYSSEDPDYLEHVEGKLLQIIQCSYPKPVMKKMRKLFLFIIHFGRQVLNFYQRANVIMNGQVIDPKSNILDLIEASVTDRLSDRPVGYRAFLQALHEINVPSNFYVGVVGWCDGPG